VKAGKATGKRGAYRATMEPFAIKANKLHGLLAKGKTVTAAAKALHISPLDSSRYIVLLRGGFSRGQPLFIPPKRTQNWSLAKGQRCDELIGLSRKIIAGETGLPKPQKPPKPVPKRILRAIAELKRRPKASNIRIARKTRASPWAVKRLRKKLVSEGRIPDISRHEITKTAKRAAGIRTGAVSKKRREKIVGEKRKYFEKAAEKICRAYGMALEARGITEQELAERMLDRLDWSLQTYDPARMKGPEKDKIERFTGWRGRRIIADFWGFAKSQRVPEINAEAQGRGGTKVPAAERAAAPKQQREFTAADIDRVCKQLKIGILESAVLFAKAAGLNQAEIGRRLGFSESNISVIAKRLEPLVRKALSKE